MANQFTFEIPGSVKPTNSFPTDYYYGPWTSTTQALSVTTGTRYTGQTVCVITNGIAQKYIFKTGIADSDLVLEVSASGNFLNLSGGTVTGNTSFSSNLSATTLYSGGTLVDSLFSRTIHSHLISDVTGLQGQLNSKADLTGATFTGGIYTSSISASTYYSGSTDINNILQSKKYIPAIDIFLFDDLKDGSGFVSIELAIDRLARILQITPPDPETGFPYTLPFSF